MSTSRTGIPGMSRRRALTGMAAVGVAVPTLAACGSDDGSGETGGSGEEGSGGDGGSSAEAGTELTTTDQIDVEGGEIFADASVVVTQPTEGEFKGFSAICTHTGCVLASVSDGTINCDCHGSKFSIEDGSVVNGPATEALGTVELDVKGDSITVA